MIKQILSFHFKEVSAKDCRSLSNLIIWLALWAGKVNQITRCEWLPERARWSHLPHSGVPTVSRKKNFPESHIINPLLTNFIWSRWLDIGLVLFLHVYGPYVLTKQALLIKDLLDDIKNTISLGILLGADKVHVTQSCMLTGANHSDGFLASMTEELNSGLQKSRNIFLNTPFHSIILLLTRLYMDLCIMF